MSVHPKAIWKIACKSAMLVSLRTSKASPDERTDAAENDTQLVYRVHAGRVQFRHAVIAAIIYKTPSDLFRQNVQNPGFRAFLDSLPDGYWPIPAPFYQQFVATSPHAVQALRLPHNQVDRQRRRTTPSFSFEPLALRAPGLVINDELDPNQPGLDTYNFAHDYSPAGAQVVFVPGAGHVVRVGPAPANQIFWNAVLTFIDA